MSEKTCANCRWWDSETLGHLRIFPDSAERGVCTRDSGILELAAEPSLYFEDIAFTHKASGCRRWEPEVTVRNRQRLKGGEACCI